MRVDLNKKKGKKDLFKGCCSPSYLIVFLILIVAIFSPQPWQNYLYVVFFFLIGILCTINYKKCGRVHCQITGYGFIGVGILALLSVLGILIISWNWIWNIFWIVLIIGFIVEFSQWKNTGSCYRK